MSISLTKFYELLNNPNAPITVSALSVEADSGEDPRHPAALPVNRVFHEPVRITHVEFNCYVDLSDCVFHQVLVIEHCHFKQGLKLADVQVKGRLSLKESTFDDPQGRWLDFRRIRVDGLLDATNVTAEVCINFENLRSGDDVWFHGVHAKNALHSDEDSAAAQGCWTDSKDQATCAYIRGKAINLDGAEIGMSCFFKAQGGRKVDIIGQIDLRAKVKVQVLFEQATVRSEVGHIAIDMEVAEVGDSVLFYDNTYIVGQIDLRAKVAGWVDFSQTTVLNGSGVAIRMDEFDGGKQVCLYRGTFIQGDVSMMHATLAGLLNSSYLVSSEYKAATEGTHEPLTITGSLGLMYAKIHGPMHLEYASIGGGVNLEQADIDGHLDLCGGALGDSQESLSERYAALLAARNDEDKERPEAFSQWTNEHDLNRTAYPQVHDQQFPLDPPPALNLRMAKIHGRVWLKGQTIFGTVDAEDAEIDGEANFTGCKVHGDLILRSATVKGRVFSDEQEGGAEPYPQVRDTVDLQGARLADVNINLKNCKGAVLPKEIRLDDAEIGCLKLSGSLPQGDRRFKVQNLRFRDMDVGGLKVKGDSKGIGNFLWRYWRDALRAYIWVGLISCFFYLGLEGNPVVEWPIVWVGAAYAFLAALVWGIQTFGKPDTTYAAGKLLDFLLHGTRFSRAFYVEVERWKRAQGDDATADEVFLSRRRRELVGEKDREGKTVHAAADGVTWCVRWLADFSMGYGVRVRRLIHLYVLSWLITWAVFAHPASVERPLDFEAVRPDPKIAAEQAEEQEAPKAATATDGNPWVDDGGQAEDWEWSPQEAFFMAMRLHVPLVELMVEENWTPADRPMEIRGLASVQYDSFAGLVQAMNLVLLPLILAGATGFLKRNS